MGVRLLGLMSIAAAMVLLGLPATASASGDQVDAIADGGFENSTCHDVDTEYGPLPVCESPSWTAGDWQAGICGLSGCFANAAHGNGYLELGRAYMGSYSSMTGTASQIVDLPPGPKELTFATRGNYDNPVTTLVASVEIDGNPVFTRSGGVDSSYADESIDLSDYAGEHEISFRADCEGVGMPVMRTCDGIAVDDVSLLVTPPDLETTFGKVPPAKTPRHRGRFTFSTDDDAATFRCRLDGKSLDPCESPLLVKAGAGRHRLTVQALDGDRVENPPARYRWRITKHR